MNPERIISGIIQGMLSGSSGPMGRRRGVSVRGSLGANVGMGLLGLALAAYEHYTTASNATASNTKASNTKASNTSPSDNAGVVPPPLPGGGRTPPPLPGTPPPLEQARLIVQAMVAAANADGSIDAEEQRKIFTRLGDSALSAEEKEFIRSEFSKPVTLQELAQRATTSELRNQVYAASVMAVSVDTHSEIEYLKALRDALGLSEDEAKQWHTSLGFPS